MEYRIRWLEVKGKEELGVMFVGSNLIGGRFFFSFSVFKLKRALHVVYLETEVKNAFRIWG